MVNEGKNTEEIIFKAALTVFQKKGLAGARMQEIADTAGINKSMLHYYYRSKELLFKQVFLLSFKQFLGGIIPILNNDQNVWEDKIPLIIDHYVSALKKNPDLPLFVLTELRDNPDQYLNIMKENGVKQTVFLRQLVEACQARQIRPVSPSQIFVTVVSGIIFPFLAQPLIKHLWNLDGNEWDIFIENRKLIIKEMVLKYLKEF